MKIRVAIITSKSKDEFREWKLKNENVYADFFRVRNECDCCGLSVDDIIIDEELDRITMTEMRELLDLIRPCLTVRFPRQIEKYSHNKGE